MKLIGVTNISFDQDFIRSQLFLFDKLLVLNMETALGLGGSYSQDRERTAIELEFLASHGLVEFVSPIEHLFEPRVLPEHIVAKFSGFSRHSDIWRNFVELVSRSESIYQWYTYGNCKSEKEALLNINAAITLQLRAHTLITNICDDRFAFCSDCGGGEFQSTAPWEFQSTESQENLSVVSIILNRIPIIPDMPYDEIIDFKAYPEVRRLYEKLKQWIIQYSMNGREWKLVCAEIDHAIRDYSEFANRQASKKSLLQVEFVCKLPLEVIESLIRMTPSRAVGALLEVRRKQIDLYESELKAPGNQFAYIREIEKRFIHGRGGMARRP